MYHRLAGLYLSINSVHSPLLHVAGRDEALLMNGYGAVHEAFSLDPRRTVGDLFGSFHGKLCGNDRISHHSPA